VPPIPSPKLVGPTPPPEPAAGAEPPASPPTSEPVPVAEPGDGPGRRRKALVPLAVGSVLVLIAAVVLAVVLLNRGDGGNGGATAGGTTASTTAGRSSASTGSAQATGSSAAGTSGQATSTSGGNAAAAGAPTATDVRNFITGYYGLLPGNPEQAYDLTGPTLQASENRSNYIAFWHRFSSVRLGPVTATDGSLVAHGTVTYVENGATQPEQHTFTLIRGQDGRLLMDSDRQD
jgi:hypothetical protein